LPKLALLTVLVATWLMQSCSGQAEPPPADTADGCMSEQDAATNKVSPSAVRVGVTGALGESAAYLAQAEGYFTQQGLSVQLINFTSPARMLPALASGQLDVAAGSVGPGLFNASENELCIKVVGPAGRQDPDANGVFLFGRQDLIDAGRLQGYGDLKGLRIGLPARDSPNEYTLAKELEAGNLSLQDVQVVPLSYPSMLVSLANRNIDLAMLPESLATSAAAKGLGSKWKPVADVLPGVQFGVVLFSPRFAAHRELAVHWMTAYLQAARDYNAAFFHNVRRDEIVDRLTKVSPINDRRLYSDMGFPEIDPNGRLNVQSISDQMWWLVDKGELKQPADLSQLIDSSYVRGALQRLGGYQ
jgi:NitT/TauT family transport system substrate-binding protein